MIEISNLAVEVLDEALRASGVTPDRGLRLVKGSNHYTLDLDHPQENDRVTWYAEAPVLLIDKDLEKNIEDGLIDIKDISGEYELVIRWNVNGDNGHHQS